MHSQREEAAAPSQCEGDGAGGSHHDSRREAEGVREGAGGDLEEIEGLAKQMGAPFNKFKSIEERAICNAWIDKVIPKRSEGLHHRHQVFFFPSFQRVKLLMEHIYIYIYT